MDVWFRKSVDARALARLVEQAAQRIGDGALEPEAADELHCVLLEIAAKAARAGKAHLADAAHLLADMIDEAAARAGAGAPAELAECAKLMKTLTQLSDQCACERILDELEDTAQRLRSLASCVLAVWCGAVDPQVAAFLVS